MYDEIENRLRWIASDVLNLQFKYGSDGVIDPKLLDNVAGLLIGVYDLNNKIIEEKNAVEV